MNKDQNFVKIKESCDYPESCLCPKSYSGRFVTFRKISWKDTSYKFRLMNTFHSSKGRGRIKFETDRVNSTFV